MLDSSLHRERQSTSIEGIPLTHQRNVVRPALQIDSTTLELLT